MASQEDIMIHYDDDCDFFRAILGETMAYSCGVFPAGALSEEHINLDIAQQNKLKKIMSFANVDKSTRSVIDFGCGWGSMINHLKSVRPDIKTTGITISPAQAEYCRNEYSNADIIEADIFDYLSEKNTQNGFLYDAGVSIGAFEHFASHEDYKNGTHIEKYRRFFKGARRLVKGNLALQSIVTIQSFNDMRPEERRQSVKTWKFISKYIFPNSLTPPVGDIIKAISGIYFLDRHEVNTVEYPITLKLWGERLELVRNKISVEQYNLYRKYFNLTSNYGGGRLAISRFSLSPINNV